jgi:hypothetical protein
MKKEKYCFKCGMRVDLRKDYAIPNMLQINENIRNKEYWYVHKKCEVECNEKG